MQRPAVLVAVALGLSLAGCSAEGDRGDLGVVLADDPSVVLDQQRAPNPGVENGTAYDTAAVDPGAARTVVLPDTAAVQRTAEAGVVRLFMAKRLGFVGHPPEPISIRSGRKNMGCAVRVEGDALVIATFGEWDSHIEGGAGLRLVAVVPDGLGVGQREGLSGEKSAARERKGTYGTKPPDAKGGYWYAPTTPADGWKAVADRPDPNRTAR
jgi:hypothetical protein